jgi:hypothetical protein
MGYKTDPLLGEPAPLNWGAWGGFFDF